MHAFLDCQEKESKHQSTQSARASGMDQLAAEMDVGGGMRILSAHTGDDFETGRCGGPRHNEWLQGET